jgi:hypothetical protein
MVATARLLAPALPPADQAQFTHKSTPPPTRVSSCAVVAVCACVCAQAPPTQHRQAAIRTACGRCRNAGRGLQGPLARLPSDAALVLRPVAWLARCYASSTVTKSCQPEQHSLHPVRLSARASRLLRARLSWSGAHLTVLSTLCLCEERLGCERDSAQLPCPLAVTPSG